MTWQAFRGKENRDAGIWVVPLIFTDGTQKFQDEYRAARLDDDALKAYCRAQVARFQSAASDAGKLTIAVGASIDLTEPAAVAIQPSIADVAQSAWFSDLRLARQLKALSDAGVSSPTLPLLSDVQARLQKNWLDSYLAVI